MPAWLIPIVISLAQTILPYVLGETGRLIKVLIDKAVPFVSQAAKDGKFPDGAARHEWVKSQILPEVSATGTKLIPFVVNGAADVAIKAAYDKIGQPK